MQVGRAIAKTEEEVADALMTQLKRRGHPNCAPPMATYGKGGYRDALVETWGQVPEYAGRGRPPTRKHAQPDWHYLQVIKHRSGHRLSGVTIKVVYGTPDEVIGLVGAHSAYVERTNLTSRQMKGRLVRKTLSYSKQLEMLEAACAWEDWVYNLTRSVKTLRLEVNDGQRRWGKSSGNSYLLYDPTLRKFGLAKRHSCSAN